MTGAPAVTISDHDPAASRDALPAVCLLCGGAETEVILEYRNVPVLCNELWPTPEEARKAARGDVILEYCPGCGVIHNRSFDPKLVEYTPGYENSLHFSPRFQSYAEALATRLVSTYRLEGGSTLEIGCGKGDFLTLLRRAGVARAVGYDPSYGGPADAGQGVTFVREYFPERPGSLNVDLVCARHVLEHVADPGEMVARLRRGLDDTGHPVVYLEVPDAGYMLRHNAVWDVIYEHPWYFTPPSLRTLFVRSGFAALAVDTSFGGQYLYVEARPSLEPNSDSGDPEELEELHRLAQRLGERCRTAVEDWAGRLRELTLTGRRVAVWGAGSKGATFLNVVPGGEDVGRVVDVNPRKHGRHVPGTGQAVVAPEALRDYRPDVVLVVNPLYRSEVAEALAQLGVNAEVTVVGADPGLDSVG